MKVRYFMCIAFVVIVGLSLIPRTSAVNSNTIARSQPSGLVCSFDPDCKNPAAPFCNITYSSTGNVGTCSATKSAVIQVTDDEKCPVGLRKQAIYPNEGTESVCVP